jgi:hypothetical protein
MDITAVEKTLRNLKMTSSPCKENIAQRPASALTLMWQGESCILKAEGAFEHGLNAFGEK